VGSRGGHGGGSGCVLYWGGDRGPLYRAASGSPHSKLGSRARFGHNSLTPTISHQLGLVSYLPLRGRGQERQRSGFERGLTAECAEKAGEDDPQIAQMTPITEP